ncbi:HEAT repeat domain-containing protein [Streptomyces sp. HUAS MG47]|uniref:hypothetical protein n=1 Tax=Streptomyces solicamelliae TaxID=3231716 RepID=UPI003878267D
MGAAASGEECAGGDAREERLARFAAEVDWSKVFDPYSGGRYGPEALEQLWASEWATADDARMNLQYASRGDGTTLLTAAAEVLPFFVEAALDPVVTVRRELLETITAIAVTANTHAGRAATARRDSTSHPAVDPAWPPVWERAVESLLPLLCDEDDDIRAAVPAALAQAAHRADEFVVLFQERYGREPFEHVAERLVLGIGELASHAVGRREEAIAWLRQRLTPDDKDEEPGVDEDIEVWLAWLDAPCHDVRLSAVEALRHVLPGHPDPAYAVATADVLLNSPSGVRRSWSVSVITEADARLDDDLPGRLALAHALLRHDSAEQRRGGLLVAASLMRRWRSAVPELLPVVAELVDDPLPDNRTDALRVLAMCGTAAHPWADRVAAHLTAEGEPHEPVRRHAVRALSRMDDARCVAPLAELLTTPSPGFLNQPNPWSGRDGKADHADFLDVLAPLTTHAGTLLAPLLTRIERTPAVERETLYMVISRWHQAGTPLVPRLLELLGTDVHLVTAAHALHRIGPRGVAASRRERLQQVLGPPAFWPDPAKIDPFAFRHLTGDDEPVLALLRSPEESGFPELGDEARENARIRACIALGPLAAASAEWLREMFREALREEPAPWRDVPKAVTRYARALWRVTGDAGEVLPALMKSTEGSAQQGYKTPGGVERLLLLAEIAATHPPATERAARRLRATARARLAKNNRFEAMALAQGLWTLTSDPRQVTDLLEELLRTCPPPGKASPTILDPLALLAEVAATAPQAVTPAIPALLALVDTDERPVDHCTWHAVRDDDRLRATAQTILDLARRGTG